MSKPKNTPSQPKSPEPETTTFDREKVLKEINSINPHGLSLKQKDHLMKSGVLSYSQRKFFWNIGWLNTLTPVALSEVLASIS